MIRNFEEYTCELNEDEREFIIPRLLKVLALAVGRENAITNKSIVKDINELNPTEVWEDFNKRYVRTSEPRIRHMIHILRVSDMIPRLIATSTGYYVSNDKEEIKTYIGSIEDRLRSIYDIRRALRRQLRSYGATDATPLTLF